MRRSRLRVVRVLGIGWVLASLGVGACSSPFTAPEGAAIGGAGDRGSVSAGRAGMSGGAPAGSGGVSGAAPAGSGGVSGATPGGSGGASLANANADAGAGGDR